MRVRLGLSIFIVVMGGCSDRTPAPQIKGQAQPATQTPGPIHAEGLHNVYQIMDRLYSGSSPDGDKGFQSLQRLGIHTIISVDGAKPDVTKAREYGMRYVHLPIGYDGVPREQALRIARAIRDLPGPVYIHCHHGKHRGPTAAAVAHLFLDEQCTVDAALAEMRRAGTDPHYVGLYEAPRKLPRPTLAELAQVTPDFPEVAPVAALAEIMVTIDGHWDRLKQIKEARWKVPRENPDLDPAHEALQLVEQIREASRQAVVRERSKDFQDRWTEFEGKAAALERSLRPENGRSAADTTAADANFRQINAACAQCHAKYRDRKEKP